MSAYSGFRRILLATDGSAQAEAAVEATIALGRLASAEVRVVHVWNVDVYRHNGDMDVEGRGQAVRLLSRTIGRLNASGMIAQSRLCQSGTDQVAVTIALAAREFAADLVVLGSRSLSDWQSIFEPSAGRQVLSAVDCPLLLVRGCPDVDAGEPRRILIAIAGGSDMAATVGAAVAVAEAPKSKVMVVHVVPAGVGIEGIAHVESADEIHATMASANEVLESAGVVAESMVAPPGPVAESVAEMATGWNADLIVVGSSRLGDLGSLILGSVSNGLLHGTWLPVLVAEPVGT